VTTTIPPDAVRVWRGFRSPTLASADFFTRLGTVFIPATVEMQTAIGLDAYLPSVPAGLPGKPDTVPDETAILFWDSQQTYADGFKTLAVRTYTLTHAAVYTPTSRADFPLLFAGTMTADQPYHLVDRPADWMKGRVTHLLGSRPVQTDPSAFLTGAATAVGAVQQQSGLQGGIVCLGADYLAFWALSENPATGAEAAAKLAAVCDWSHVLDPLPTSLDAGLWDVWPGLTIASGASLNMQFTRRWEQ
jgi:hypothetical protein